MSTVLDVRDIAKSFGGVDAVRGVSFDVREREILGLIGPCLLYTSDAADE